MATPPPKDDEAADPLSSANESFEKIDEITAMTVEERIKIDKARDEALKKMNTDSAKQKQPRWWQFWRR